MSTTRKHRRVNELRRPSGQSPYQAESVHYLQSKAFPDSGVDYGYPLKKPTPKQDGISETQYSLLKFTVGSLLLGLAYFMYVSNLFESVTKFSHLSELERELSLPPDVAFRYSHFKRLSESDTFFHGFISTLNDGQQQHGGAGNICSLTRLINPFRSHLLTAEVLQGGAFHLLKRFKRCTSTATSKFSTCQYRHCHQTEEAHEWRGQEESFSTKNSDSAAATASRSSSNSRSKTKTASSPKSNSKTKDDRQVQIEKVGDEVEQRDGESESERWRTCFGSGNLFYFYANSIWVAESFAIILLFHLGCTLSKSIFGGGVSVLIFLVIHPQRTSSEWIFSFENKIEWVVFLSQICTVSHAVLKSSTHPSPSWTATVKVALSTAAVFLTSGRQAQWLLISQLGIITGLELFGVINPYVSSLVLFGQLTGWQYATMALLDTSFASYSPFLCTLGACIATVYVVQPALERRVRLEPGNRNRNGLLRAACLLVASQLFLHAFTLLATTVSVSGNAHYSWSFFMPSVIYNSANVNCGGQSSLFAQRHLSSASAAEATANNNNNVIKIPAYDKPTSHGGETLEESSGSGSPGLLFLSSLLCSCNYPTLGYTGETFLSKYVLHILTSIYVIATGLILTVSSYYYGKMKCSAPDSNGNNGTGTKMGSFPGKSNLPSSSSELVSQSQSYAESESFFINESTPLITFNVLQLLSFMYFSTRGGGKTWEIMFISQLAALCSLVCDQKRITFVFGSFNSRKPVFSNRVALHWCLVLAILLSLLTTTKRASNEMFQNSRAKYEIGNKKIQDLSQAMKWIEANTDTDSSASSSCSCFVGLEIPLLYLHLTTRRDYIFDNYHYDNLLDEMMLSANSRAPKDYAKASAFEDVYWLFSRRTSIADYHSKLKAFNATHLFLSSESCTAASASRTPHSHSRITSELLLPFDTAHAGDDSLKKAEAEAATATFSFWSEKSAHENDLGVHVKRLCDLGRVWDAIEGQPERKSTTASTSTKRKKKDNDTGDILCLRLINDPDVRPFKRVFENDEYTILSLSDRSSSPKRKSKPKSTKNKNAG